MKEETRRQPMRTAFPCASLAEALKHLRRPPTPEAVRFKIQTVAGEAAQVAPYVDARLAFDRLDLVCGERWNAEFEPLPEPLRSRPVDRNGEVTVPPIDVRCRLTLFEVTRQDVGAGDDPKAAFSDAIKRAAVHFGIGRALYALGAPWLREGEGEGELRRNRKGKLIIDARTEAWLRSGYARWLEGRGRRLFGEPLDHGDEPGAPGFEDEGSQAGEETRAATSQGHGKGEEPDSGMAAQSRAQPGRKPASATSEPPAGQTRTTIQGRLVAVSDGSPGSPPATALDRKQIAHWRQAGRYKEETITALAGLAFGDRILERLSHEQVRDLARLLECAVRGRVSQRALVGCVTRLERKGEEREAAVKALREYLQDKASDVELLGRRKAA
jgi:hypothetical protein